ncbi:hypothetical protein PF005_g15927 [Phytophthora fragariae]|uniref:Uncharacterized protein n=2 Tax=Phytophthora TaxID=4783 RepID=A0A6A3RLW3_9STRA|nr:hypothetical protein PF003_g35475 [Phytophthora fragariae]KAE8996265.1 hypothetical protein PR002_g19369 [Phytophthora rubi]KAE8932682.1 hypothetical protein PF009_g17285 [Phytophthora fragariae]KAE8998572.1 hypothetical protein PF011_g14989 [Phytophthora fragariae]KAE8999059.1 hypothetical protein PR001_g19153 [Phytophthora rubi]
MDSQLGLLVAFALGLSGNGFYGELSNGSIRPRSQLHDRQTSGDNCGNEHRIRGGLRARLGSLYRS